MMSETWFTSDHHFGHKNILQYEKDYRPFETIEEMNEKLIETWNKTINPKDFVFHLGDFCFGRINIDIAGRLHGRKRLIMGNHDIYPSSLYIRHFENLYGAFHWKRCILTHVPIHTNHLAERFFLNIHGHLHARTVKKWVNGQFGNRLMSGYMPIDDLNYLNVAVERHNLTPVNSDLIMERLKEIDQ